MTATGNPELDKLLAAAEAATDEAGVDDIDDGEYDIDLSDVPDSDFTPFVVVNAPARITKANKVISKSSGNPQIALEATLTDEGDLKGRKVWWYAQLRGAGRWMLKDVLKAIGIDPLDKSIRPGEWVGEEILVTTKIVPARGEYEAKTEVKRVSPVASTERDSLV
jgi:hypothetical protein